MKWIKLTDKSLPKEKKDCVFWVKYENTDWHPKAGWMKIQSNGRPLFVIPECRQTCKGQRQIKYFAYVDNPEKENQKEDIREVFNYWRDNLSTKRSKLDSARRTKIRNALKSFSVDECKRAIDGNKSSEWHQINRHKDIGLIFRNNDKIEYFIGLADKVEQKSKEKWLTDAEVDAMARRGEEYHELYKRLSADGYKFNTKR